MWENFKNGFVKQNPVFGLYLGMCSSLAISTTVNNGLGMGLCVTVVLLLSNVIISAIRNIVPDEIHIPVYIVIIASLVSIIEMLTHAFMPELYSSLGVFLSLIAVNCIILGRAEAYASKHNVLESAVDALGSGFGYTFALLLISVVREFLSTGGINFVNPFTNQPLFGFTIEALKPYTISLFSSSVGSFLTFACFAALFTWINNRNKNKKGAK